MANIACYDLQGQPLKHFYQWDSKRSIVITGKNFAECTVCDFGIDDKDKTITVKPQILDDRLIVEVPDFLLTNTKAIKLYVCEDDDNGSYKTLFLVTIPIKERPKPEDYEGESDGFEHYHSNKSILDKLSITDGKLYFDGEIIGSQTYISPEKLELLNRISIGDSGDLLLDGEAIVYCNDLLDVIENNTNDIIAVASDILKLNENQTKLDNRITKVEEEIESVKSEIDNSYTITVYNGALLFSSKSAVTVSGDTLMITNGGSN